MHRRCPLAIVLAPQGAGEGALGVARGLGIRGVPVLLVTEAVDTPVVSSRYVDDVMHLPRFTHDPAGLVRTVAAVASRQTQPPVLFPTADPDLDMVAVHHRELLATVRPLVDDPSLTQALMDKGRFLGLAEMHGLPVPRTCTLESVLQEPRRLAWPILLKPRTPTAWHRPGIEAWLGECKARRIDTPEELNTLGPRLRDAGAETLAQEYVPGPDDQHCDLHMFLEAADRAPAWFSGRKVRIYPAHAGSATHAVSEPLPELAAIGLKALNALGYTGLANMNFKRHPATGRFLLLEINPRVSQWNILGTHCGINLPWYAYAAAAGLDTGGPTAGQKPGPRYFDLATDLRAWRQYRRSGEWPTASYLRSVLAGPHVWQNFDRSDPGPFFRSLRGELRLLRRRLRPPRAPVSGSGGGGSAGAPTAQG